MLRVELAHPYRSRCAVSSVSKSLVMVACLCYGASSAAADEPSTITQQIQTVRSITEIERQSALIRGAQLTQPEAQQFVPVYQDYRTHVVRLNNDLIKLLKDYSDQYATLTNDQAQKLTHDWLALERGRIDLKTRYAKKFDKVLPAVKVARVLQIENRMDLLQMVGAASVIPLAKP
jgi:hypothetical protein